jgi:ubiquinone/menaquinone biosynthesis C-methylase UbiE
MNSEPRVFTDCPVCGCSEVSAIMPSLAKDMSVAGFRYVKCSACKSYYQDTLSELHLKSFYSDLSPYRSGSSKVDMVEDLVRQLGLKGDEHVLDLGCGSGAWALPILPYCAKVTCVDIDTAGLSSVLKETSLVGKEKLSVYNGSSLEFLRDSSPESFDLVLSMFSLEHDTKPVAVIQEMRRVLRANGRAVILVPSANALQITLCGAGFYWFQAPWHTFIPSKRGLHFLAKRAGYSNVRQLRPARPFYSWFWLRAWSDLCGQRHLYDRLRSYAWFVRADIFLDKIFDRISWILNRPSYLFLFLRK